MDLGELLEAQIPCSTYRLQFNKNFRFVDAKAIIPYLHDLGIDCIYASPYFHSRPGSLHGYDIVDYNALNPDIGTQEEHDEFVSELQKFGMGQILDMVPNHMCVASSSNAYWVDVLENGPSSIYAAYFDIDWDPVKKELKDKLLVPILGDQYGKVLENQELILIFSEGAFFIQYYEFRFPIRPHSYLKILEHRIDILQQILTPDSPDLLEFLSIMTALKNLPSYLNIDKEKITERTREKEIIKKRLCTLIIQSSQIREHIEENINIFNGIKGKPLSFDRLDELLSEQIYRLSHWRVASEEINYRRFFDINDLGAIRVEEPTVFENVHRLVFKLIREGKVTGLRVDHPDGLYNPSKYFQELQKNCFLQLRLRELNIGEDANTNEADNKILQDFENLIQENPHWKPFYILGEKILTRGERMPEGWLIFSTTGYFFMNALNELFIDSSSVKVFDQIYQRVRSSNANIQDIIYEKKKLIMQVSMSSELNTLGHILNRLSEKNRHTRDFTLNSLTDAITEVITLFPVYRSYITDEGINEIDKKYIELTLAKAKKKNPAISESIYNFLENILLLQYPENFNETNKAEWLDFVMKFQQITGPVMAKGVEDTTFYIYTRFVSLNEVGGSPERFGTSLKSFHGQNIERQKCWPHDLNATSTHDSKWSEDLRARLNVLTEFPKEWDESVKRWTKYNNKKKVGLDNERVPDRNEEYLLYQTLAGVWPFSIKDEQEYEILKQRIKDYFVKALRESKINTSWINVNEKYEKAADSFVEAILSRTDENKFLEDFEKFNQMISPYGLLNSLSQTLIKVTSPGVPDFYQGTEIWNLSLVDPDNRRAIDYSLRKWLLEEIKTMDKELTPKEIVTQLMKTKEDGRIKQYLIFKSLNFRKENHLLFETGEYIPLECRGEKADNIFAFARILNGMVSITIAARFFSRLVQHGDTDVWKDTSIEISSSLPGTNLTNIFTGESVVITSSSSSTGLLKISDIFKNDFPVALLKNSDSLH